MTDYIIHKTTTRPKFKDRVLILFGAAIVIESTIKVDKSVQVEWSSAKEDYPFNV